jgi:hypothetical protein
MSTENTTQPTANLAAVKIAEKTATAASQTAPPAAKKTVRKAAQKAPRKSPARSPAKAPARAKPVVSKKPARRPANKSASAPTKKATAKPTVKAAPIAQAAESKLKKPKLIRDSFTFPKDEYQAIAGLKQKALGLKHSAKKSEILRAGLKLLSSLNDKAFLVALNNVPALKTGRPAKS